MINASILFYLIAAWLMISIVIKPKYCYDFDAKNVLPLRGILALSIIAVHLYFKLYYIPVVLSFCSWGRYIVAVFFFITGYGLTYAYEKKGNGYLDGFLSRRVRKIMFPYLLCILAYQVYQLLHFRKFDYIFQINELGGDFHDILLPTSWFVVAILAFYVSFYFVLKIVQSIRIGILCLLIWSFSYYYILRDFNWGYYWTESIFAINLGMIFSCYEGTIKNEYIKQSHFFNIIGLLFFLLMYIIIPTISDSSGYSLPHWYSLFSVTTFPLFFVLIIYNQRLSNSSILNFLGTISYEIYLVQGAFCKMVTIDNPFLYVLFVYSLSLFLAWILKKFCSFIYSL